MSAKKRELVEDFLSNLEDIQAQADTIESKLQEEHDDDDDDERATQNPNGTNEAE